MNQLIIIEGIKLLLQLVGALIIARLTVKWALRRYKSEKTWERRLGAYADAVAAISEMRAVVGRWFNEAMERRDPPEELQIVQRDRYRAAQRKLDETVATARLLLPPDTSELLLKLQTDLSSSRTASTLEDHLDDEYGILNSALGALVEQGRRNLEVR